MAVSGRWRRLHLALALMVAIGASAAARAEAPQFMKVASPVTAREALADTYGQLIVDEMHKALLKGAQPSCLNEKGIARADLLRDRGEALLVQFGQGMSDKMMEVVNAEAADKEFLRLAGANALNVLRTLMKDANVIELLRLSRVGDRDRMVDRMTEIFDRYVLLHRIKIDRISPLVTGSTFLMEKNRAVGADEKSDEFVAKNGTPAVKRYIELVEAAGEALESGIDRERLERLGPTQLMAGLDTALVASCIGE